MIKVTQLECEQVDLLLYCVGGVLPSTKPCGLGVSTKGEARSQVAEIYDVKMEKNASRLDALSDAGR